MPENLKGATGGKTVDGDGTASVLEILRQIQSSVEELKIDSRMGQERVCEIWTRLDALELGGSTGRHGWHDERDPHEEDREDRYQSRLS